MEKNDLTTKTKAELTQTLGELRAKMAQFRFDLADKKLKRTSDVRETRRQIARIMTIVKNAQ